MKKEDWKNPMLLCGVFLFLMLAVMALLGPFLSPFDSTSMDASIRNQGCTFLHLFGTDKFGRDLFVRVCEGVKISLFVGIGSACINGLIGIVWGGIAGYGNKGIDFLLMRMAEVIESIPSLLYVIFVMLVFGTNGGSILAGLCVSGWTQTARIVRGEVLRLKDMEYCLAARLSGAGGRYIFFRHILPNVSGAIIVSITSLIPQAIFTEAFLSFVGVGIPAPKASLGTLIQGAQSQMQVYPYQMLIPMCILVLLILALQWIGTGFEEVVRKKKGK